MQPSPRSGFQAMLTHVCESGGGWRELRLRHASVGLAGPMRGFSGKVRRRAEQRECCFVDLERVRQHLHAG